MHWDALPETPHHSQHTTPPHPIQLHANLDMYTQSGGHPRTQSTNTHADINAARYPLLHSSSAETSLFREHPVLHFLPCVFHPPLAHPTFSLNKTNILSQPSKFTLPIPCFTAPQATFPRTLSPFFFLSSSSLPPSLSFLPWPGRQAGQTCSECAPVMG